MKFSKKSITALSFAIGTSIFVTTAFADAMIGSGYDQLKGSIKNTAAQMEKGLSNYTVEGMVSLKDNDQTLLQFSTVNKFDMKERATETTTLMQYSNGETSSDYSYSDNKMSVWKSGTQDTYYVSEYSKEENRRNMFANPFEEQGALELEKIADAVVGNLKDYVQAEERAEGGKVFSGSLSEAQVPALVNAVSSFGMKQMIRKQHFNQDTKLPVIESDIFVKKVVGTAVENKQGIVESITGDITLSGKDAKGAQHDLALNVVVKLSDIGSTKIKLPDLTGANVEKANQRSGVSNKHVGTYRNNIVIEKDGQYVKIGERTLEIVTVDKNKVTGKYYETVKPGFEAQYPEKYNFTFEDSMNEAESMPGFTYTNAQGKQERGQLHPSDDGKVYLELNIEILDEHSYKSNARDNFDGQFIRVFEE